jgi:hypothetical protein
MKTCGGSRGTAPLILNLEPRWRWVVNITPRPLYPGKEPRYPLNRGLCGPQNRSVRFGEGQVLLPLPRFEPPDRPVHSLNAIQIALPRLFLSSHCWCQGRGSQDWTRPVHTVCCPDTPFSLSEDGHGNCNGPTKNVTWGLGRWHLQPVVRHFNGCSLLSGLELRTCWHQPHVTSNARCTLHRCRHPEWDSEREWRQPQLHVSLAAGFLHWPTKTLYRELRVFKARKQVSLSFA